VPLAFLYFYLPFFLLHYYYFYFIMKQ